MRLTMSHPQSITCCLSDSLTSRTCTPLSHVFPIFRDRLRALDGERRRLPWGHAVCRRCMRTRRRFAQGEVFDLCSGAGDRPVATNHRASSYLFCTMGLRGGASVSGASQPCWTDHFARAMTRRNTPPEPTQWTWRHAYHVDARLQKWRSKQIHPHHS